MDGSECRDHADAWGALARQAQGKERSALLDIADEWDALAEQNDALEIAEPPAVEAEWTAEKMIAEAARLVLHRDP